MAGTGIVLVPFALVGINLFAATPTNMVSLAVDPVVVTALFLGLVVVTVLNAFFVAGQVAVDLLKSSHAADREDESENELLTRQIEGKENVVSASTLGARTMVSWLILICLGLSPWVGRSFGWITPDSTFAQAFTSVFLITVVLSIIVMFVNVVVELVAKAYALNRPAEASLKLAPLLRAFDPLFRLPSRIAAVTAGLFTRRFGTGAAFSTDISKAEEEIKGILDSSEQTGEIDDSERNLLQSVFDFGDTVARSVMTPRVDVEAVPVETDLRTLSNLVEATGFSRFPVYKETDDQIVGIIHAKDVLKAMARGQKLDSLESLIRPAYFVPETKTLHDLLAEMRTHKTQMVIIQDEMGGTAGIVTIEDVVEELVGDIVDEYDVATPELVSQGNKHLVIGRFHLDDLNEAIGSHFDSEEFDSVGGYVFGLFGRQPRIGETIEHENVRFTIVESDGRRIQRIEVEFLEDTPAEAEAL